MKLSHPVPVARSDRRLALLRTCQMLPRSAWQQAPVSVVGQTLASNEKAGMTVSTAQMSTLGFLDVRKLASDYTAGVSARLYLNPSTVSLITRTLRETQAHPHALPGCDCCQLVGSLGASPLLPRLPEL